MKKNYVDKIKETRKNNCSVSWRRLSAATMESITAGDSRGPTTDNESLETQTFSNQEQTLWGSFLEKILPTRINPKVIRENLINYNSILKLKEVQDINPLDDPDADPRETLRKVRNLNERGCCSKAYIRPTSSGRCCPPPTPPILEEDIDQISQIVEQETKSLPRPTLSRKIKLRRHHHRPTHSEEDEFQKCDICKGPICSHGGPERFSESGCCFRPCDDSCDPQRQKLIKISERTGSKATNRESLSSSRERIEKENSENFKPKRDSKATSKLEARKNTINSVTNQSGRKVSIQSGKRESTTNSEGKNSIKDSGKIASNLSGERENNNKNIPLTDINEDISNTKEKLIVKDVIYCGDSIKALNIAFTCDNERHCTLPSLDIAKTADEFATVLIGNDSCPLRKQKCHNENVISDSSEQISEDILSQSKSSEMSNKCCKCCKNMKESKSAFDGCIPKSKEYQKSAESIKVESSLCERLEREAEKCQVKPKHYAENQCSKDPKPITKSPKKCFEWEANKFQGKPKHDAENPCSKDPKPEINSLKKCPISHKIETKSDNDKNSFTKQFKEKKCTELCPEENKHKAKDSEDTKVRKVKGY